MIDLRSDTVTKPTPEMRRAMAEAEVGDDVYGEDPTVNRLEQRAAEVFGKEAALFVPTGTMANTIGIKVHTQHGQEVICESRAHILNYELAMMAWFAGCVARPIAGENGLLHWDQIRKEIRPVSPHYAPTGLIEIENTHNVAGGSVYPPAQIEEIGDGAHSMGLKVHMDGARVFNAAAACGKSVKELCAKVDTVNFCLSKGLGAPVGSMLVGTREAIDRGRLYRKRLGGGMRQAGVLAAAGLIAIDKMSRRLQEDHANARLLAEGIADLPGIRVNLDNVRTNIVIFDVSATGRTSAELSAAFKERGLRINGLSPTLMRMVTHHDVNTDACRQALEVIRSVLVR
ncbi:MAG: low specificity L-threonine aldolase [Bryobacterales bacterium]|nr:low specificity L-threonine aldolase [Bryobacterales bacterium]